MMGGGRPPQGRNADRNGELDMFDQAYDAKNRGGPVSNPFYLSLSLPPNTPSPASSCIIFDPYATRLDLCGHKNAQIHFLSLFRSRSRFLSLFCSFL